MLEKTRKMENGKYFGKHKEGREMLFYWWKAREKERDRRNLSKVKENRKYTIDYKKKRGGRDFESNTCNSVLKAMPTGFNLLTIFKNLYFIVRFYEVCLLINLLSKFVALTAANTRVFRVRPAIGMARCWMYVESYKARKTCSWLSIYTQAQPNTCMIIYKTLNILLPWGHCFSLIHYSEP